MSDITSNGGQPASSRRAHVIVVGNEKGGSGKTTTTMHLIVALLRLGFSVGSLDIDSRQRSLTRYIENRRQTIAHNGVALPVPQHAVIQRSPFDSMEEAKADERDRFAQGLAQVYGTCDFVVIDTPGNDTFLSRLSHSFANTVITPINDSFVDLDVLAAVDGVTLNIIKPSIYSEMVWEQKLQRAKRDGGSIDWIVMRNRLSNLDAKNKRFMAKVTEELARRIGFRVAPGFSERVIFREMFLQGLTVLDVLEMEEKDKLSISHVAARQEVRNLLAILRIPEIDRQVEKLRQAEAGEGEPLPPAPKAEKRPGDEAVKAESESAPGFKVSEEQKLPRAALHQAIGAMVGVEKAKVEAAKPSVAPEPAAPSVIYPLRPTPPLQSGRTETRGEVASGPDAPQTLPEAVPEAKPLPVWHEDAAIDTGVTPTPAVPALPPELEALRNLPTLPEAGFSSATARSEEDAETETARFRGKFAGLLN